MDSHLTPQQVFHRDEESRTVGPLSGISESDKRKRKRDSETRGHRSLPQIRCRPSRDDPRPEGATRGGLAQLLPARQGGICQGGCVEPTLPAVGHALHPGTEPERHDFIAHGSAASGNRRAQSIRCLQLVHPPAGAGRKPGPHRGRRHCGTAHCLPDYCHVQSVDSAPVRRHGPLLLCRNQSAHHP